MPLGDSPSEQGALDRCSLLKCLLWHAAGYRLFESRLIYQPCLSGLKGHCGKLRTDYNKRSSAVRRMRQR